MYSESCGSSVSSDILGLSLSAEKKDLESAGFCDAECCGLGMPGFSYLFSNMESGRPSGADSEDAVDESLRCKMLFNLEKKRPLLTEPLDAVVPELALLDALPQRFGVCDGSALVEPLRTDRESPSWMAAIGGRVFAAFLGQAFGIIERGGPADIMFQKVVKLRLEPRIGLRCTIFAFQIKDQRHQRLRHITPAKLAKMAIVVGSSAERIGDGFSVSHIAEPLRRMRRFWQHPLRPARILPPMTQ